MNSVRALLAEQLSANQSSSGERAAFAGHRARLTEFCARGAPLESELSLCVLGAGNANDLELASLAARFRAIHLVDLDPEAVERAIGRESEATRARLVPHAPVDISGALDRIERWASLRVTPEELAEHAEATARALLAKLGGPFDVVLSACLLTQMQLGVLSVLGDRHPLFEAVRYTLSLTHLAVLSRLTRPSGRALLVTDLTADSIAPEIALAEESELAGLVPRLVAEGRVFQVAQPELLREMARDNPTLSAELEFLPTFDAWRWQNGRARVFLVCALEAHRNLHRSEKRAD
jgi:hypothetical protein